MEITLNNGKTYNFEMNGTVGIVWATQRTMPKDEETGKRIELDLDNPRHHLYLYYTVFRQSNKKQNDIENYDDFECNMSGTIMRQMREYFWERWKELDPLPEGKEKSGEDDPKND